MPLPLPYQKVNHNKYPFDTKCLIHHWKFINIFICVWQVASAYWHCANFVPNRSFSVFPVFLLFTLNGMSKVPTTKDIFITLRFFVYLCLAISIQKGSVSHSVYIIIYIQRERGRERGRDSLVFWRERGEREESERVRESQSSVIRLCILVG